MGRLYHQTHHQTLTQAFELQFCLFKIFMLLQISGIGDSVIFLYLLNVVIEFCYRILYFSVILLGNLLILFENLVHWVGLN